MVPLNPEQQSAIEDRLKQDLKQAQHAYEDAKLRFLDASDLAHSIGLKNPDSTRALGTATAEYSKALAHYSAVVDQFAEFILRRNVPPG